jgi:type IV pilus assembly protein PilE
MQKRRGFTLIEVLIVIGIISILAAIALPSYNNYIRRGKLAEATSQLSSMRVKMEQYFQDNRSYVGACANGTVAPLPSGDNAKYFTYSCPPASLTATTYLIDAVGNAAQGMAGFEYTIDQNNTKATVSTPWPSAPSNPGCWIIRQDGSC